MCAINIQSIAGLSRGHRVTSFGSLMAGQIAYRGLGRCAHVILDPVLDPRLTLGR